MHTCRKCERFVHFDHYGESYCRCTLDRAVNRAMLWVLISAVIVIAGMALAGHWLEPRLVPECNGWHQVCPVGAH